MNLLHDMTVTVLYDLLYSVCHRIHQRLTLYSDFVVPIPYPDYCFYKLDFGGAVFTSKSKFKYRPQILNWIEIWEVHWPIQYCNFHYLYVIPSLFFLYAMARSRVKTPQTHPEKRLQDQQPHLSLQLLCTSLHSSFPQWAAMIQFRSN